MNLVVMALTGIGTGILTSWMGYPLDAWQRWAISMPIIILTSAILPSHKN